MLIAKTYIEIQQNSTTDYPDRRILFHFPFCVNFHAEDNWKNLTNKAEINLPRKIFFYDRNLKKQALDKNLGGFSGPDPYFLRGDSVTIKYGYVYKNSAGNDVESTKEVFKGYIVQVTSKSPFTLSLEDNMYKLKQVQAPDKTFKKDVPLKTIVETLVSGTGFSVSCTGDNFVGEFITSKTETVAQVLERLRKEYHIEAYFRGDTLRVGILVYDEEEAVRREKESKKIFSFKREPGKGLIISDDLIYNRKDDVLLSAKCYSINKKELESTTRDGEKKTKNERLEVIVGREGGESRTLYFWNVTDKQKLRDLGEAELKKYFYTGFRGSFTTFAIPTVQSGDNIWIEDPVLPERSGHFRVKEVEYDGGTDGQRQKITIDYKLD